MEPVETITFFERPMNYFDSKKILVPHDFSDLSGNAVEVAIKIAENRQHVTVLHVVDPAPIYGYTGSDAEFGGPFKTGMPDIDIADQINEDHRQRALKMLQGQFGDAHHAGLNFATIVHDASHGITEFASENKFDLIVMPSHGRTGMKRLLIGSVAERVVRMAHCPVLVLRG